MDRLERERSGVEQFTKPTGSLHAQGKFGIAFGLPNLRRVDVRDPDLATGQPECVTINHAGRPDGPAQLELGAAAWNRSPGLGRIEMNSPGQQQRDWRNP